eukprot:11832335-Alexandrium_andersonii.AAC.1
MPCTVAQLVPPSARATPSACYAASLGPCPALWWAPGPASAPGSAPVCSIVRVPSGCAYAARPGKRAPR